VLDETSVNKAGVRGVTDPEVVHGFSMTLRRAGAREQGGAQ